MLNIPKKRIVFAENIIEINYSSGDERPPCHREDEKLETFSTNLELNESPYYVASDIICGIKFQMIKVILI